MNIYAISSGRFTKVGISAQPRSRLSSMQTGTPHPLKLCHVIPVKPGVAAGVERAAHERLRAHHERGEWFRVTPDEALAAIMESLKAVPDTTPYGSSRIGRRTLACEYDEWLLESEEYQNDRYEDSEDDGSL